MVKGGRRADHHRIQRIVLKQPLERAIHLGAVTDVLDHGRRGCPVNIMHGDNTGLLDLLKVIDVVPGDPAAADDADMDHLLLLLTLQPGARCAEAHAPASGDAFQPGLHGERRT